MKRKAAATRDRRISRASTQRREQQRLDLRARILSAAGDEFLEHGYESFSLRRVAERVGYTPTTIYLYFHSKDDLLLATVQDGFNSFDRRMQTVAAKYAEPLQRIAALGEAYIEFGMAHPALYRLMFMQRSEFYFLPRLGEGTPVTATESAAPVVAQHDRPRTVAMTLLVAAVTEGLQAGVLQPGNPQIIADVLWSGAHGLVSLSISPLMSKEHAAPVTDLLLKTLIDGIKRH